MSRIKYALLIAILSALSIPTAASGAIILSEDFDDWPDTKSWEYWPSPWDAGVSYGTVVSVTKDSVTHSAFEVTASGRGGTGKSLKSWHHTEAFAGNTYHGALYKDTISGTHTALYIRWYMKIPTGMVIPYQGQKLWRYNLSDGSDFGFNFDNNNIIMCPGADTEAADCFAVLAPATADGEWHAHQLYVDLATSTVTWWVDGVQTYHKVGVESMPAQSSHFGATSPPYQSDNFIQHFPLGNNFTGEDGYYQTSWQALEVDDLVIATTKAETDPVGSDATAPTITAFGMPPTASSLTVNVDAFIATDNTGVTDYCITTVNSSAGCSWSGSAPSTATGAEGANTFYAWARDAALNVSTASTDTTTITLPSYGNAGLSGSGNAGLSGAADATIH